MAVTARWTAAGIVAVALVVLLDQLLADAWVPVSLLAVGPLVTATGGSPRATACVAAATTVLSCLLVALEQGPIEASDWVRPVTVGLLGALAVHLASLRVRLERRTRESDEATSRAEHALGQLDVIFSRSPVGLALHDLEGRFLRVNDRLAEINGLPPEAHIGRTLAELVPGVPEVHQQLLRVAETGVPEVEVELTGETPARPGERREWVASYWPVRAEDGEPIGVGTVVFDVTDRRAAERELRVQTDRYETLLTALSEVGEGMIVLEDGRCVYANPAFEQISGYAFPELAAMESVFELVVADEREEARRRARLRTEREVIDASYQTEIRRRDGAIVLLELAGVPLEIPGRSQLVVVVRDATARRRAEEERERLLDRAGLLAEASALFDQSLDEERTLRSVAELCVRDLADTCIVVLGGWPGPARRAIAVAREPGRERELDTSGILGGRAGDPVLGVLRGGTSAVLDRPDGVLAVVPLLARGRVHGAIAAGFEALPEERRADTLVLLEDLGRRAALALDNARLYAERSQVAQTLQRALLPPHLPLIPGAQVAARYLAAGAGNEVGGDFYDCFSTGGDDWALVIGDVCGKGAEAAAITAIARYTLRASVLHSPRPRQVLEELNEALLRQGLDYRFCTALYASVTPRAGGADVVLATGGHPLPLVLRAGGAVETAGTPGTLLGVLPDPDISEEKLFLAPGDSLVLYTDGVVEAGPVDESLAPEALASLLRGQTGRDASDIAAAVEDAALSVQDGRLRDDVAVVVLRIRPGAAGAPFDAAGAGVATPA